MSLSVLFFASSFNRSFRVHWSFVCISKFGKKTILFGISYSIEILLGDLSYVFFPFLLLFSLLTKYRNVIGIDVIKFCVGFCLVFICIKHKDINLLANLFNG